MTKEEQRIAVAEWMGDYTVVSWSYKTIVGDFAVLVKDRNGLVAEFGRGFSSTPLDFKFSPNYPEDLNAMREAVGKLLFSQRRAYRKALQIIVSRELNGVLVDIGECIDATAAQRCEALLSTVGKWRE